MCVGGGRGLESGLEMMLGNRILGPFRIFDQVACLLYLGLGIGCSVMYGPTKLVADYRNIYART